MWLDKLILCVLFSVLVSSEDFSECGRTLPDNDITNTTITELNAALHGEFPHMCTMFTKVNGFNVFIGGASLIAPNQLLTLATAVHKMRNFTLEEAMKAERDTADNCNESHDVKREIFISCGDTKLQSNDNPEKQVRKISKILIHPDYNSRSLINDLAVLIVEKAFNLTAAVGPVCLPSPQQKIKNGADCVATGHGRETFKFGSYSRDLRKIKVPIVDNADCEKTLNEEFFNDNSIDWKIHSSFMCAGGVADTDTCEGDGGGPLVCSSNQFTTGGDDGGDDVYGADDVDIFTNDEVDLRTTNSGLDKIVQVGVTAWGYKCGKEGIPSVYSSVANGRCWVDQIMSCYLPTPEDNNVDLRITDEEQPASVGKLSERDCGAWLQTEGSNRAACGCKQLLNSNTVSTDEADYDIRNTDADLDLRQV